MGVKVAVIRLRYVRGASTLVSASLAAACAGPQSVLDPAGPENRSVNRRFWSMVIVSAAVWLAVVTAAVWGALGRRRTKRDLIPGYTSSLFLDADRPGVYRAQCAEFCGAEHAKMALTVVVHPRAEFASWLATSRSPAAPPNDSSAMAGERVFLSGACSSCHAITGTPAIGTLAPDL